MIKEAIDKIIDMATGHIIKDDFGRQVWDKSGSFLNEPKWPTLKLLSLTALEDYLKTVHPQPVPEGVFLHIASPTQVTFRGPVQEPKKTADVYVEVHCEGKAFPFGQWLATESFIILLQTMFVADDTTADLLKIVGNLSSDTQVKTLDNGVAQEVTAKTGITIVGNVKLPNPVTLRPYRTFREVEQPESLYVFRMQKEGNFVTCALFDVGGNLWEQTAIASIKEWLRETGIDVPVIG
ncbi:MAG: hypothetical protein A4E61_00561 [Syntrophorhabdus sp. PtaB.Bin184]|nr:MAG: hypothetical protein A4E61_00561 [Syntrophorhabdus sp. PtaB.Bin184]